VIGGVPRAHIAANAPDPGAAPPGTGTETPESAELTRVQQRLRALRTGYARGTVSDNTMFTAVPMLEATEKDLKSRIAKSTREARGRAARQVSPADVRREWDAAAGDVAVRRAIISRYLRAVIIRKSSTRGPGKLDYAAIEPVWRDDDEPAPGDLTA
jgi:hypothetical protein